MDHQNKQPPWDSPTPWWIPNPLPAQPVTDSGYGWIAIKHVFRTWTFQAEDQNTKCGFLSVPRQSTLPKTRPVLGPLVEYFFLFNPAWGRTADTGCSPRQEGCSYLWDQRDRCGVIATGRPGTAAVHFAIHFGQMGMLLNAEGISRSTSTFESRLNSPFVTRQEFPTIDSAT